MEQRNIIIEFSEWISKLSDEEQLNILTYITEKLEDIDIDAEKQGEFIKYIDEIMIYIADNSVSEDTLKKDLELGGINKLFISPISEYIMTLAEPYIDANIIKKVDTSVLESICKFVINKMILYKDYKYIPFSEFSKTLKIENDEYVRGIITFTHNYYMRVARRDISPDNLVELMNVKYRIDKDLCDIIISPLKRKIDEVHQAYLLRRIESILSNLSSNSSNEEELED